jgi:ADP-ribosyltransferase exoenzyme
MKLEAAFRLVEAAAWWDRMTADQQTQYLKTHPKSRKKVAGPKSRTKPKPEETPAPIKPQADGSKLTRGKGAHKAAAVDLTPEQVQAVKEYTGSMYLTVNPRLRAGKPVAKADMKEMKLIDQAFSKAKTTEPIEVYRGLGNSVRYANLKPGESFKDEGFVSTSTDKDTAFNFARGEEETVMHIQVPKGSKAISVDALSVFKKGGYATRSENEILLNRGASYKVISVTPAKGKNPKIITVEYSD